MNETKAGKNYRNGLICAVIGSVLTMIGDFLIGANPAADLPTGVVIIDLYGDCLRNSDLRMMAGGMLGVFGMPLTGIGYYRLSLWGQAPTFGHLGQDTSW